jgi:type I restriction enzyme S subunit
MSNLIQTTLGEIVSKEKKSIISGPFGSNIGKIFFKTKGIPVIRGNNLSTGGEKFKDDGFVFITREKADELNCYAIKNDLIFTAVGTIGQVGIIDEKLKYDEYVISNKQLRVRFDNNKITPLFAYYWFSSYWIQKLILQRNVGSTVPLINLSVLKGLPITLPKTINVQNRIVEVLENISLKIELNNKINIELEAMAKTLYDYWFVQFDFPNANGKPYKSSGGKMVWNAELKRGIPEGWDVNTLSSYINYDKSGDWGKEQEEGNYNQKVYCVRGADINGLNGKGELKTPERYILEKNLFKTLDPHDLIVEISGGSPVQSTGRLAYITEETLHRFDAPIICSNFCKAVTLKSKYYFYNFVFQWNSIYDAGVLFGYEGKTSGIKNLLFESFVSSHYTAIPPIELAEKFYDFMKPIQIKKEKNLKENQELASLRDWLLPMLMNGQVSVGGYEVEANSYSIAAEEDINYKK